jgi:hypothetical protein
MLSALAAAGLDESSLQSSVESFGRLFAIILALAIGEAFKQFVADKAEAGQRKIHWDRAWSLVAFIFLVVPFFHGMARYFFDTYHAPPRPNPYWFYLIIDTMGFTFEAVLFFILSRSLDPKEWVKFYLTVIVLLAFDIVWGSWVAWRVNPAIRFWVYVNLLAVPALGILLWVGKARDWSGNKIAAASMLLLILRTVVDYYLSHDFYFPAERGSTVAVQRGGHGMSKPIIYIASPYTKGDVAVNTHFQCKVFDQLLTDGKVWPVAPLWSHFQHTLFPRPYKDWIAYDQAMLPRYDACLRLTARLESMNYELHESTGADNEVATFERLGKPVFKSVEELYRWVDEQRLKPPPTTRG